MSFSSWSLRTALTLALLCALVILVPESSFSQSKARVADRSEGPRLVIYAEHPREVELALDEIELDWSGQPNAKVDVPAQRAVGIAGAQVVDRSDVRARIALAANTLADLAQLAASLEAANPGAQAYAVVYEPGAPKTEQTQALLTKEVGLLLEPAQDVQAIIVGLPVDSIRPVSSVPGGYVVMARDLETALHLADTLRRDQRVRTAYTLLKRKVVPK